MTPTPARTDNPPARLDVSFTESRLIVTVPKHLWRLSQAMRTLGARWEKKRNDGVGAYTLPLYVAYARAVCEAARGPYQKKNEAPPLEFGESFKEWIGAAYAAEHDEPSIVVPANVQKTWDQMYEFQRAATRWLVGQPFDHPGALLALSPGLGKTIVSLTAAAILEAVRVLIVSPLSLLRTWEYERELWLGGYKYGRYDQRLSVVHGDSPPETGWVVTNYNTITNPKHAAEFWDRHWDILILDESVLVKNRKTQRFATIKNLREAADRLWLLSGSPITKHPDDLWTQFHLIEPKAFPSYWNFTKRWCALETTQWGTKVVSSSGRDFHADFGDVMYVKHQEEVLPDLPDMIYQTINVNMTHRQEQAYSRMLNEFLAKLDSGEELAASVKLAQLIRLQQISSNLCNLGIQWPDTSGKHETVAELVETGAVEFPMLIWTHWRPGAEALAHRLKTEHPELRVMHVAGGMDSVEVDAMMDSYKEGEVDILILSLGVGKFGHTLTKTRTTVYLDKTWNADDYVQSLHRVRRIGLTHVPRVISLTTPNSIDEMVEDNLAGKAVDIAHINNADLARLLRSLSIHSNFLSEQEQTKARIAGFISGPGSVA